MDPIVNVVENVTESVEPGTHIHIIIAVHPGHHGLLHGFPFLWAVPIDYIDQNLSIRLN
jgi:hypothetical protein